jgi:uncharacterized protein (TIGR02268 family)
VHRDRLRWPLAGVALLLALQAVAAEPGPQVRRELRRRTLVIDDQTIHSLPEIHVSGGSATVIAFEIPVKEGGALLADVKGLFYPPTQTDRIVILVPKADLGSASALHVSLSDGTVLSFKLTSLPDESDVQVDVVLALKKRAPPDSAEALRGTIETLRGELDECQANSATAGAAKLATLLLSQSTDEPQTFDRHALRAGDKQNRLLVEGRWVYRLVGLTYLVFTVDNRDPQRNWVLERAEVKLAGGNETLDVKVLAAVTDLPALPPGVSERLVVAFRTPPLSSGQRYTVTLVEKDGGRRVVLEGLSP